VFVLLCSLCSLLFRTWFDFTIWTAADFSLGGIMFVTFLFGITLCSFAVSHILLVLKNQTTLEQMKRDFRWDLGSKRKNWEELMGANVASWFLPVAPVDVGDGIEFGKHAMLV
jgi:hypothetical protein